MMTPRQAEQNRRQMEARRRALTSLAKMHPEEFRALRVIARNLVDRERGPLPGDEGNQGFLAAATQGDDTDG